jgi:outer membrane PBP1 activator LpoA protein
LKKLGIVLLSLAVSACTTTTDNKSNYQELTKGTSDKEKYEAIVSKI